MRFSRTTLLNGISCENQLRWWHIFCCWSKKGDEAREKKRVKKLREACHVNNCRRLTLVVRPVTQRGQLKVNYSVLFTISDEQLSIKPKNKNWLTLTKLSLIKANQTSSESHMSELRIARDNELGVCALDFRWNLFMPFWTCKCSAAAHHQPLALYIVAVLWLGQKE